MKCCFFSSGYRSLAVLNGDTCTTGGAEAQIAHLAAALARIGHEVALIYGDGRGRVDQKVVSGVTCIDAAPCWRRPVSVAEFWRAMSAFSPDLLYARLPSDFLWIIGLFARRHPTARFVYAMAHDLHCDPWTAYDYNRWFHAPVYALGLRSANVIAVQHAHQERRLGRSLQSRAADVPNLVCSINQAARAYGAATFDAIWVAKIRPEKQLEHFLDLASALPDLRFAVVGGFDPIIDAEMRLALESRLIGLTNLQYFGPQQADKVFALLKASRVLVNTSRFEGFPNTMLEAWSVGVPVISLSVDPGGVIEREHLGLLSRIEAQLRKDVSTLSCQEPLNQRLGANGLAYVRRRHSLEAVFEALTRALSRAEFAAIASETRETQ
jgi:glycosyltransferase involved in cell wall biosynthesis